MAERQRIKTQRGVALILAVFLFVLFSFLLLSIANQVATTSSASIEMRYMSRTLDFALGGVKHLVDYFALNSAATDSGVNDLTPSADANPGDPDPTDRTLTGFIQTNSALLALTAPTSYFTLASPIRINVTGRRDFNGLLDITNYTNRRNEKVIQQRHRRGTYVDSRDASNTTDWSGRTGATPAQFAPVEAIDGANFENPRIDETSTNPIQLNDPSATGSGVWRSNGSGTNYSLIIDSGWLGGLQVNAVRWFQTNASWIITAAVDRWDDATQTWIEITNNSVNPLPRPGLPGGYTCGDTTYLHPFYLQNGSFNSGDAARHPHIWRGLGSTYGYCAGPFGGTSYFENYYTDLDASDVPNDGLKWTDKYRFDYGLPDPGAPESDYVAFIPFPTVTTRALRLRILSHGGTTAEIGLLGAYACSGAPQPGDTNPSLVDQSGANCINRLQGNEGFIRNEGRRIVP